jgi:hypothetical protein
MAHERLHHACTSTGYNSKSTILHVLGSLVISLPIKLVAAEAGFLPPGPAVDFADMVNVCIRDPRLLKDAIEW